VLPLPWALALCAALGFAAVYLLLPRPRRLTAWWGSLTGTVALLLAGWLLIRPGGPWPETVLFYIFSAVALVSGVLLIAQSNPARAALSFALVVLSTCGLFLLQAAPFLMAATTIIYAGAIIVTFLFVLMLAQQEGRSDADERSREPLLASAAGFLLLAALIYVVLMTYHNPQIDEALANLEHALGRQRSNGDQFFEDLQAIVQSPDQARLPGVEKAITEQENRWLTFRGEHSPSDPKNAAAIGGFLDSAAADVGQAINEVRQTMGDRKPDDRLLSDFSGPPASETSVHDPYGNAPLPAENTAYLGRSLFTDYLLAIELAGTLLLVATIGAIAIAARREEPA
jgi:NADH:ubiquinone oxidoreductase subunit 6 (subunit J)